jgi:hypothetical protein
MIKLKRAYEKPSRDDGLRVLVDRLWPRGLTKERAAVDLWLKEVAPSPELRNTMSRLAGQAMAGRTVTYDHLPFFYSDMFEFGYEALGDVDSGLETVADWKQPYREGVVYFLRDGRVRGVLLWNVWGQLDAAQKLIAEPGPFRPENLKGRLPV